MHPSFFLRLAALVSMLCCSHLLLAQSDATISKIRERGYIIVGNKQVFPTMNFRDPATGRNEGFFAEIARGLAHQLLGDREKVEFHLVNDENRFPKLASGEVDFLIDTIPTSPEKEELAARSEETFVSGSGLLVKRGSPIRGLADIGDGTRIAFVNANQDVARLRELAPGAVFVGFESSDEALQAVKDGRADVFTQVVTHLFRAASRNRDCEVVDRYTQKPYYIFMRKGEPRTVEVVNAFLRELRSNGEYARIYDAAFGEIGGHNLR
jgi:putative glutamine transport system substrate-binding protein